MVATPFRVQKKTASVAFPDRNRAADAEITPLGIKMPHQVFAVTAAHDSAVTSIKWSPNDDRHGFASGSLDTSIQLSSVKDLNKKEEALFAHNGHVALVVGFDWCQDGWWTIRSVPEISPWKCGP
jgi:WD40 repeat protein